MKITTNVKDFYEEKLLNSTKEYMFFKSSKSKNDKTYSYTERLNIVKM